MSLPAMRGLHLAKELHADGCCMSRCRPSSQTTVLGPQWFPCSWWNSLILLLLCGTLAPGSLLRTQHLHTQQWAKWPSMMARYLSSTHHCQVIHATGVSQRNLLRAATKFPTAHGFLSATSMAPGWLGMPNKGYRSSWDNVEECKDKDLWSLYIAHLYETSEGCREQPPAFAPITSVANFSFTTGFILSLFKSAGLWSHTRLTSRMQQFLE